MKNVHSMLQQKFYSDKLRCQVEITSFGINILVKHTKLNFCNCIQKKLSKVEYWNYEKKIASGEEGEPQSRGEEGETPPLPPFMNEGLKIQKCKWHI